jgi:hypothetical protein
LPPLMSNVRPHRVKSLKSRLTPLQKKQLSYAKDRRNTYGERGANSRFAISESKAVVQRSRRRVLNGKLQAMAGTVTEAQLENAELSARAHPLNKKRFHKSPDRPLGEVVAAKHSRRAANGMGLKRTKAKA